MIKKNTEQNSLQARWMVSFADFLSVVLAFMVLIYSSGHSIKDANKYTLPEKSYFSVQKSDEQSNIKLDSADAKFSNEYLLSVFTAKFQRDKLLRNIQIRSEADKIIMNFTENFFNNPESTRSLVDALSGVKNGLMVYASSLSGAQLVAKNLTDAGFSEQLGFYESALATNGIDIVIYP